MWNVDLQKSMYISVFILSNRNNGKLFWDYPYGYLFIDWNTFRLKSYIIVPIIVIPAIIIILINHWLMINTFIPFL